MMDKIKVMMTEDKETHEEETVEREDDEYEEKEEFEATGETEMMRERGEKKRDGKRCKEQS